MKPEERERIRDLFLSPCNSYPAAEAARLTDGDADALLQRIETGELDAQQCYVLERREVLHLGLERWPLETIYQALGHDAEGILPPLLRPEELRVGVPAYAIRVLEYAASKAATTTEEVLRELLHDYALSMRDNAEENDEAIPGLAEALFFPHEPLPARRRDGKK